MSRWSGEFGPDLPVNAFRPRNGRRGGMTLEGGGKGDAPAPDPRMGEAALKQIELNERVFNDYVANDRPWIRGITNEMLGISRTNAEKSAALSDYQLEAMRRNDERYWNTAVPFENRLLEDVNRFDSQAYKDQQVAQALADTQAQFSNAQAQQQRGLARMGVNPNSGRAQALANQTSIAQAAAMASAANKTRQAADQIGLSTKMQMYGGMRGLAGLGATNAQLGLSAMGTANQSAGVMGSAADRYVNANNSALGAYNSGISAGIQGLGSYSQLQQNAAKINNDADPFATILGAGAQLGASWLGSKALAGALAAGKNSDRRLKTDIRPVGVDERTGLTLYEFSYKGSSRRFVGVMADEVEKLYPEAVFEMPNGYKAVNYAALGLEMVEVEGEPA